jgi:gas vesicle protein
MESSKLISTLITGIAIGVTLGVLFAPEKGEELRNKITDGNWNFLDFLKDNVINLSERSNSALGSRNENEW